MASATDPHGFHDMSEREIVDWFAESGAQPGSTNHEFATRVLHLKERETEREASSERLARYSDAMMEELTTPDPQEPTGYLTQAQVAILAVLVTLGFGVFGVTGSAVWGFGAALAFFCVLLIRPVRARVVRLLSRVVR